MDERAKRLVDEMSAKVKWRKVKAPRAWLPEVVGEELVGRYAGKTIRQGRGNDHYDVVLVGQPDQMWTMTGVMICQLFDAAQLQSGDPVRVMWGGVRDTANGRQMKLYELFVADVRFEQPAAQSAQEA